MFRDAIECSTQLVWLIIIFSIVPVNTSANEELKNMPDPRVAEASKLMLEFAQRTGLESDRPLQRYLWTDAFAVCNFLGLAQATGEQHYQDLALRLIDQVHHVLGRHREDDPRSGWISGLSEHEGEAHPTRGGLRIGKQLPEREEDAPLDERLTKWMHALEQASHATDNPEYHIWARELAVMANDAFTYIPAPGRTPKMYWKMSIDLTRPLVTSMGQHDPIDGYITAIQLRAAMAGLPQDSVTPDLEEVVRRFGEMTDIDNLASADPLAIGGLMVDAYRVLLTNDDLLEHLTTAALMGLEFYAKSGEFRGPAEYRLAFRELGLVIGLHAVDDMWQAISKKPIAINRGVRSRLEVLISYLTLGKEIESFWRDPTHQDNNTWIEHQDINEVMLATCLEPDGFLILYGK